MNIETVTTDMTLLTMSDDYEPQEELLYTIKGSDPELDKIRKLERLFNADPRPHINFQYERGDTLLHISIRKRTLKVIEWLLKRGAKTNMENHEGKTQFDVAKNISNQEILKLMETDASSRSQMVNQNLKTYQIETNQFQHKNPLVQKKELISEVSKKNKTSKRKDIIHGDIYQLKLLMLFLYRAVSKGYSFRLATEIEEAKKFDDLVFEYKDENGHLNYQLLQAKHRLNDAGSIQADNLLTLNDEDFSLVKYFFSYSDAKKEKLFKKGLIKSVTICTNIGFDIDNLEENGVQIQEMKEKDSILDIKGEKGQRYQFTESLIPKLHCLLEEYNLTRLARRLVQCILKNTVIKHHERTDIFINYHGALSAEVIDVKENKFFERFLRGENLTEIALKFRTAFINELSKQSKEELEIKSLNQAINLRISIKGKKIGFITPRNFGITEKTDWPKNVIDEQDVDDFLKHLIFAVHQPNEEKLGNLMKDEIGEVFDFDSITTENTYNKFFMKILNWFQGKEGEEFLSAQDGKNFFEEIRRGIPILFNVENPVHPSIKRKTELKKLKQCLEVNSYVSITGLGGVGKSELAKKFIDKHCEEFENRVVWINAENSINLEESFRRLAAEKLRIKMKNVNGEEKDIKTIVEDVYRFFSNGRSLFVFDNAESLKGNNGILNFLPNLAQNFQTPHILLTSRNKYIDERLKIFELDVPDPDEVIQFIQLALVIDDDKQVQDINELLRTLQYFPLALQQTVAYIKAKREDLKNVGCDFTIQDYLNRFKKKTEELLNFSFPENNGNTYAKTTLITWAVTLDQIKGKQNGNGAIQILEIISFFSPEKIPVKMFAKIYSDNELLGNIIGLLRQYSMINSGNDPTTFAIHRLVQEVTRLNLKERKKEILSIALRLFDGFPKEYNLASEDLRLDNVDHAISAWTYACEFEDLLKKFHDLPLYMLGELTASLKFQDAEFFGMKAIDKLDSLFGDNHLSVIFIKKQLGSLLCILGKYEIALKHYSELNGKIEYPFFVLNEIALCFNRIGRSDLSIDIFEKAYELTNQDKVISNGEIEQNLGLSYYNKGEIDKSLKIFQIALKKKIKKFGYDNPCTLNTMNSIACVSLKKRNYSEAYVKYQHVLTKRKEILGPNHPDTLVTQQYLCQALIGLDRYEEALIILTEVQRKMEQIIPNHPNTAKGNILIVETLILLGRYNEVAEKYQNILHGNDSFKELGQIFNSLIKMEHSNELLHELNKSIKEVITEYF